MECEVKMIRTNVLTSLRIKEVNIVTSCYLFELENAINEAIKDGWEIQGNIINPIHGGYSVAMVKYGEIEE